MKNLKPWHWVVIIVLIALVIVFAVSSYRKRQEEREKERLRQQQLSTIGSGGESGSRLADILKAFFPFFEVAATKVP